MGEYINSTTARFDKSLISCGVMEVHHLPKQNPSKTAFSIANALYHKANPRPAAFVMFSDVVGEGANLSRGQSLSNYITSLNAGDLFPSQKKVNPRTGNVIQVYLWQLDHEALRKWYQDELANRVDD
jgi:hypothetical protein